MIDCSYHDASQKPVVTVAHEDVLFQFQVLDICGNPVDITGRSFTLKGIHRKTDANNSLDVQVSFAVSGATITNAASGLAEITLAGTTSATYGDLLFEFELWDGTNNKCLIKGTWYFQKAVIDTP